MTEEEFKYLEENHLTLEKLQQETDHLKNQFVIFDTGESGVFLRAWEDEFDFYYEYIDSKKYKKQSHCVLVGMYPLKGRLPDDEYERLKYIWNLNCNIKCK